MKKNIFNLYSPAISALLFIFALWLQSAASGLFLAACVYSFHIKTALIPTGKKFRIGVRTPKIYYEARGELPRYRRHLIWVYWFFFGFGVVFLLVDLLNIL